MSYSIIDRAVFGPRHAKRSKGLKIAAKGSAIAALLAATGFAGAGLAAMTPAPSTASAFAGQSATAVLTATYRLTPQAQLCSDFTRWEARPGRANLERIAVDVFAVPWNTPGSKYGIGSDAFGLVSDVLSGKAQYVAKDEGYIVKDGC